MHTAVMKFIVDLFEAGIDALDEHCLACCYHLEPILPGNPNDYFRRVRGPVAPKKRLAIVRAFQKAGFSIEEMRQLLEVRPANESGSTDAQLLLGEWYPKHCVSLASLVEAVKYRYTQMLHRRHSSGIAIT